MISFDIDPQIKISKTEELIRIPRIVLVNSFNEESAKAFRTDFSEALATRQSVVPVVIDSYGGHIYSLTSMIDVIQASPVPVMTIVTGKAMSCGAILFSFGSHGMRIVGPNATVMIHDVSSVSFGKVNEIKADASEVDRLNQSLFKHVARNCGQKDTYFLDLIHERGHADWYLTPEDCMSHKLATRIGTLNVKVSVKVDISYN